MRTKILRTHLHNIRDELSQALDALTAKPTEPTDSEAVQQQLLEMVAVRVTHLAESHPFGSTVQTEEMADIELESNLVEIPIETDSLPYWFDATWSGENVEVELEFRLTRVDWHPPIHMHTTGSEYAVYNVEIV